MTIQPILITGASGFVATHIIEAFLSAGHSIRGTVRFPRTAEKVLRSFPNAGTNLSFVIVPDIVKDGAFDEAVKGVSGVIHTATAFTFQPEDNERDALIPAIAGTENVFRSIHTHAPQVKRVVLTLSFAAMVDVSLGTRPEYVYSEADWNPISYAEAAKKETPGAVAYCAAKALAERAAWDFMNKEQLAFDLVAICPPLVYGPNHNATVDLGNLNTSSGQVYDLMAPTSKPSDPVPDTSFFLWVDVRDVARAHLKGYEVPEAGGHRFLVAQGNFSYQDMADVLRGISAISERVPVGNPGSGLARAKVYGADTSKAERMLGIKYRGLNQCMVDSAMRFMQLEGAAA